MLEKDFIELKNQIKEVDDIINELKIYFTELKNELRELSKELIIPPVLDFDEINLTGDINEFKK